MEVVVLVALVVTSGLLAGFFFAWWCSVMIGLKQVGDSTFVETMQEVNRILPNPRFAIPFFAPIPLAAIAVWLCFAEDHSAAGWWSVAALVLSIVTFAITAAGNVPLNNALDEAGRSDDSAARNAFEDRWVRLNDLRTYTSIGSFIAAICVIVSLD